MFLSLFFKKCNGLRFNDVNFFKKVTEYALTTLLFKVTMPSSGRGQTSPPSTCIEVRPLLLLPVWRPDLSSFYKFRGQTSHLVTCVEEIPLLLLTCIEAGFAVLMIESAQARPLPLDPVTLVEDR